ncbi:MAG TPA: SDR family NAD(P)-dependent oxidoreductase, partial [Burkholderiaceae bacterium]|nr:SDR family NAD(P)-dependent oxidoreductase [Burkholderiaceae bacterium]
MNQIDLKGRVAVITGGAQGIGFAAAQRMLRSGASVALWDIDAKRLHDAETSLNAQIESEKLAGRASSEVVELSMEADIAAATQAAVDSHGRIDILVNNAGITGG